MSKLKLKYVLLSSLLAAPMHANTQIQAKQFSTKLTIANATANSKPVLDGGMLNTVRADFDGISTDNQDTIDFSAGSNSGKPVVSGLSYIQIAGVDAATGDRYIGLVYAKPFTTLDQPAIHLAANGAVSPIYSFSQLFAQDGTTIDVNGQTVTAEIQFGGSTLAVTQQLQAGKANGFYVKVAADGTVDKVAKTFADDKLRPQTLPFAAYTHYMMPIFWAETADAQATAANNLNRGSDTAIANLFDENGNLSDTATSALGITGPFSAATAAPATVDSVRSVLTGRQAWNMNPATAGVGGIADYAGAAVLAGNAINAAEGMGRYGLALAANNNTNASNTAFQLLSMINQGLTPVRADSYGSGTSSVKSDRFTLQSWINSFIGTDATAAGAAPAGFVPFQSSSILNGGEKNAQAQSGRTNAQYQLFTLNDAAAATNGVNAGNPHISLTHMLASAGASFWGKSNNSIDLSTMLFGSDRKAVLPNVLQPVGMNMSLWQRTDAPIAGRGLTQSLAKQNELNLQEFGAGTYVMTMVGDNFDPSIFSNGVASILKTPGTAASNPGLAGGALIAGGQAEVPATYNATSADALVNNLNGKKIGLAYAYGYTGLDTVANASATAPNNAANTAYATFDSNNTDIKNNIFVKGPAVALYNALPGNLVNITSKSLVDLSSALDVYGSVANRAALLSALQNSLSGLTLAADAQSAAWVMKADGSLDNSAAAFASVQSNELLATQPVVVIVSKDLSTGALTTKLFVSKTNALGSNIRIKTGTTTNSQGTTLKTVSIDSTTASLLPAVGTQAWNDSLNVLLSNELGVSGTADLQKELSTVQAQLATLDSNSAAYKALTATQADLQAQIKARTDNAAKLKAVSDALDAYKANATDANKKAFEAALAAASIGSGTTTGTPSTGLSKALTDVVAAKSPSATDAAKTALAAAVKGKTALVQADLDTLITTHPTLGGLTLADVNAVLAVKALPATSATGEAGLDDLTATATASFAKLSATQAGAVKTLIADWSEKDIKGISGFKVSGPTVYIKGTRQGAAK